MAGLRCARSARRWTYEIKLTDAPGMAVNFAKYVTARTKEYQHFPRSA